MYRFNVNNTAPRPESYLQGQPLVGHSIALQTFLVDYTTANPNNTEVLTEDQRSQLYAELASGAESGERSILEHCVPILIAYNARLGLHLQMDERRGGFDQTSN